MLKPDCCVHSQMAAELQVPTPLVPLRESLFLRYCKRHDGLWVVVDVSMEVRLNPMARYRRRPSGCVIQELPNDYSKVMSRQNIDLHIACSIQLFLFQI